MVGTEGRDDTLLDLHYASTPVRVGLRGGDDRLLLRTPPSGTINGEDGRDVITVDGSNWDARLDLSRGTYTSNKHPTALRILRFQDVNMASTDKPGYRVTLVGDADANRLTITCGVVRGGGGSDTIRSSATTAESGCGGTFHGDAGNDRMTGGSYDDTLLGGDGGGDVATGGAGSDRCVAERRAQCERR